MTSEIGAARSELIDRLVEHAASNGLTDTSLRDLAAAVGTSHRMLNYHFGSRAGVVAAVVERIESQQRDALAEIAAEATSTTEIIERQWAQLSDPALAPFIRLFFEVTAQAMFGRPGTDGFLAGLTEPWLDLGARLADDLGVEHDPAELRLGVAVIRGLLLDAVASGDPAPATASLNRFLAMRGT
ncbi:MAG: TetR family transcriptional regulator [Microthrixaceae bacterium]